MSDDTNPYINLPYLDNIHQKIGINGYVNKLKIPLRNAVNANRTNARGMDELVSLLEDTIVFINQNKEKPKKRRTVKPKKEYDLP